jgi:hypothetical protein
MDHLTGLIMLRATPDTGRWRRHRRPGRDTLAHVEEIQAENVAAMHRVHQSAQPKRLAKGCYAVWSEFGTLPINELITWRLEHFATIAEARNAYVDRMHTDRALPHYFDWLGVTDMEPMRTPLSRLWIYRADPREHPSLLPDYGFETGPRDGVAMCHPDLEDDRLRHLVMAEEMGRRALEPFEITAAGYIKGGEVQ